MLKETFKEVFKYLFDNPVIFLVLLGNYALLFMFGPIIGLIAGWFISTLYLAGLHGSLETLWDDIKRLAKWGFIAAVILYLLFFAEGVITYIVYKYLIYGLKVSFGALMLLTPFWALVLALILHGIYITLFSSKEFGDFRENLKRFKELYTSRGGFIALLLLWGFMYLTLISGVLKFFRTTVGLFSVIATFWLTYYTFLGVKVFKNNQLKEVRK